MIIIRLKSGFELPITCEKFTFSKSSITGEITNYSIEGIKDNKPLFFRAEDIECIWQKMDTLKMPYEWIPVSERLPKYGQPVLTYNLKDDEYELNHIIDEEDGEWFTHGVSAWMPLPEPYKEEE